MFQILKGIISFTGTGTSNIDTYIGYGCIAFALIIGAIIIDKLFDMLMVFLPKSRK